MNFPEIYIVMIQFTAFKGYLWREPNTEYRASAAALSRNKVVPAIIQ